MRSQLRSEGGVGGFFELIELGGGEFGVEGDFVDRAADALDVEAAVVDFFDVVLGEIDAVSAVGVADVDAVEALVADEGGLFGKGGIGFVGKDRDRPGHGVILQGWGFRTLICSDGLGRIEGMSDLSGKRAVVLGGTGVLGTSLVKGLRKAGATVTLLGRNPDKLMALGQEVGADFEVLDLSSEEEVRQMAGALQSSSAVDILVAAAGGNQPAATLNVGAPLSELSAQALREVVDLNLLTGAMIPVIAFADGMVASGKGCSIITVSSASAGMPLTKVAGYSAAKAAVANFTRWAAVELGRRSEGRVRVNALEPGFFLTEQNRYLLTDKETGELTERGRSIIDHTPAGRFGEPDELVGAVNFLASDDARFVTGSVLTVDGGFTASWGV